MVKIQKRNPYFRFAGVLATAFAGFLASSFLESASAGSSFRSPAKRYGAAYSIKVTLVRNGVQFVVPMWVKPDQKDSTLDLGQLTFMGWTFQDFRAEDVVISGVSFGATKFKGSRSDWAVKPEHPKNCCMGVIGQDFLRDYHLRFDPKIPVHIEWTRGEGPQEKSSRAELEFDSKIRPLFSVNSEVVRVGGNQYDLGTTPFQVDFPEKKIVFEMSPMVLRKGNGLPLFTFNFVSPDRDLSITQMTEKQASQAKQVGLVRGARVTELNGSPVSSLNELEIRSLLKGKKSRSLEIGFFKTPQKTEKSKIIFDFEKNEFTQPRAVSSPSRRN